MRSIDIAVAMGFSKPSVSVAMKNLRENGYISMDADGLLSWKRRAWKLPSASMTPPQADGVLRRAGR